MTAQSIRCLIFACLAVLAGCAAAPHPAEARLAPASEPPPELAVPAGQTLRLSARARGTQIYACAAKGAAFEWTFQAPQAELLDDAGAVIGTHFAGPTWKTSDGSTIVGAVKAKAPAPGGAIPWLLLEVKTPASAGQLANIAFIQRLETQGGQSPAAGCDAAHVNATEAVPYTAVYRFFGPR